MWGFQHHGVDHTTTPSAGITSQLLSTNVQSIVGTPIATPGQHQFYHFVVSIPKSSDNNAFIPLLSTVPSAPPSSSTMNNNSQGFILPEIVDDDDLPDVDENHVINNDDTNSCTNVENVHIEKEEMLDGNNSCCDDYPSLQIDEDIDNKEVKSILKSILLDNIEEDATNIATPNPITTDEFHIFEVNGIFRLDVIRSATEGGVTRFNVLQLFQILNLMHMYSEFVETVEFKCNTKMANQLITSNIPTTQCNPLAIFCLPKVLSFINFKYCSTHFESKLIEAIKCNLLATGLDFKHVDLDQVSNLVLKLTNYKFHKSENLALQNYIYQMNKEYNKVYYTSLKLAKPQMGYAVFYYCYEMGIFFFSSTTQYKYMHKNVSRLINKAKGTDKTEELQFTMMGTVYQSVDVHRKLAKFRCYLKNISSIGRFRSNYYVLNYYRNDFTPDVKEFRKRINKIFNVNKDNKYIIMPRRPHVETDGKLLAIEDIYSKFEQYVSN